MKYKEIMETIDYNNILPPREMRYYVEEHLVKDEEFIEDVDKYLCMSKIKNLNENERLEKLSFQYHNTARQFMLKLIIFKHLSKQVLKCAPIYTDIFWQDMLKKFLEDNKNREEDVWN